MIMESGASSFLSRSKEKELTERPQLIFLLIDNACPAKVLFQTQLKPTKTET